jgi:hypothetical protein
MDSRATDDDDKINKEIKCINKNKRKGKEQGDMGRQTVKRE